MKKIHHQETSQLTIYSDLEKDQIQLLDNISTLINLQCQTYLFHQHSPAKSAYMLEEGSLLIERSSANGKRQIMAFVFPGNFIGFTHNEYYEFSVQALTDSKLTEIPRRKFIDLSDDILQLKSNLRQISCNILAHTMNQVFALGQKKAHERVCYLLDQLYQQQECNKSCVELVMTRQDIADYLGLTIETVSRAFSKLKQNRIITMQCAHLIEIIDMEQLKTLAIAE